MSIENDDLLYVYDVSEGVGKKIKYETLKSGTGGTGEFGYWNRSGTILSPVNSGDNVEIGGGNINLNADGSASLAGGNINFYQNGSSIYADGATFGGNVLIKDGTDTNITLNAGSGSAVCAGNVQSGGNAALGQYTGVVLRSIGIVQVARPNAKDNIFVGYQTANDGTNQINTSRINADGSATFADSVNVGDALNPTAANKFGVYSYTSPDAGRLDIFSTSASDKTQYALRVLNGTTSAIEFDHDGSAYFAGKVTSASTEASDSGTTLATKDYVDANSGGGGGELPQIIPDGSNVFPVGAIAFLRVIGGPSEGAITPGQVIDPWNQGYVAYHSNVDNAQSSGWSVQYGTWRCLGMTPGRDGARSATLFQRVS